jgi:hypothetical protein
MLEIFARYIYLSAEENPARIQTYINNCWVKIIKYAANPIHALLIYSLRMYK